MFKRMLVPFVLLSMFYGCSFPQYIVPQKDMDLNEINASTLKKKILIASRQSDFKNQVTQEIIKTFEKDDVHIKIIGIERLHQEDAHLYSAIILINTCMAWQIDRNVEKYLDKYGDLPSIIVLTTSDGGEILPDTKNYNVDAISSASIIERVHPVADQIIGKIKNLLEKI